MITDGSYSLKSGDAELVINPIEGGRITSFKLDNYNFLTGKEIQAESYGSTFWPSPQSIWNWPPPPVLDDEPYSAVNNGRLISVVSGKDNITGFQFIKEIISGKRNSFNLNYSIINITNEVKKVAPWEISRVHKGGLFFAPINEKTVDKKFFEHVPLNVLNGILWYEDEKTRPTNHQLSFADCTEGWMAYAIDGKLFIKKFQDVKPGQIAPGEGEILIYVSSQFDYIELEVEGEYNSIKPGEKANWKINWLAVEIPYEIKIKKGNNNLVSFVRNFIKGF